MANVPSFRLLKIELIEAVLRNLVKYEFMIADKPPQEHFVYGSYSQCALNNFGISSSKDLSDMRIELQLPLQISIASHLLHYSGVYYLTYYGL